MLSVHFHYVAIISFWKRVLPFFWIQTFCQVGLKFANVSVEANFQKSSMHLKSATWILGRYALCLEWWNWPSCYIEEDGNVKKSYILEDRRLDRGTKGGEMKTIEKSHIDIKVYTQKHQSNGYKVCITLYLFIFFPVFFCLNFFIL